METGAEMLDQMSEELHWEIAEPQTEITKTPQNIITSGSHTWKIQVFNWKKTSAYIIHNNFCAHFMAALPYLK